MSAARTATRRRPAVSRAHAFNEAFALDVQSQRFAPPHDWAQSSNENAIRIGSGAYSRSHPETFFAFDANAQGSCCMRDEGGPSPKRGAGAAFFRSPRRA